MQARSAPVRTSAGPAWVAGECLHVTRSDCLGIRPFGYCLPVIRSSGTQAARLTCMRHLLSQRHDHDPQTHRNL